MSAVVERLRAAIVAQRVNLRGHILLSAVECEGCRQREDDADAAIDAVAAEIDRLTRELATERGHNVELEGDRAQAQDGLDAWRAWAEHLYGCQGCSDALPCNDGIGLRSKAEQP